MVRPRASEGNLALAFSIADVVMKKGRTSGKYVTCRGKKSVFGLLAACVPDLMRSFEVRGKENRNGITEAELNKYLVKCGYCKLRSRKRIKGTKDKWDAGFSKWQDREWMNPYSEDDIHELRTRLNECRTFCPSLEVNFISGSIIAYLKPIWISEGASDVNPDEECLEEIIQEPCQQIPRMNGSVRHRLFLGETPSRPSSAGLDGVPPCFGPVFHTFYQVDSQPTPPLRE
jgi:hypothetical protein